MAKNDTTGKRPMTLSEALAAKATRPNNGKAAKPDSERVFVNNATASVLEDGGVVFHGVAPILDNERGRPTQDKDGNLLGFSLGTSQARIPLDDGGQIFAQTTWTRHLPKRK